MRHLVGVILLLVAFAIGDGGSTASAGDGPPPGDVNCDGRSDSVDALALLRHVVGLPVYQMQPCPAIGSVADGLTFGDASCDGNVNAVDALTVLRAVADIEGLENCALLRLLPDEVAGIALEIEGHAGQDFIDRTDADSLGVLAALGAESSDVSLATADPAAAGGLNFHMGALNIPGVDWNQQLTAFAADQAAAWQFQEMQVAGRDVLRVSSDVPMYYYPIGDTLAYVQTSSNAAVEDAIAALPEGGFAGALSAAGRLSGQGGRPRWLTINILVQPTHTICAGYPEDFFRLEIIYWNALQNLAVPSPTHSATILAQNGHGSVDPGSHSGRQWYEFNYKAETWGEEALAVEANITSDPPAEGDKTISFDVELCLSGKWQDGSRVLQVVHIPGAMAAEIISGTLVCGVQGRAFSGDVSGNIIAGNDVLVCNEQDCVDEGKLPQTELRPFEAIISDDAETIGVTWIERFFDDECQETGTGESTFAITRQTFEEPRP